MRILISILMLFLFVMILNVKEGNAQMEREEAAFGIQIQPIIPSGLFRVRSEIYSDNGVDFTVSPEPGFMAGAVIRMGLSGRFSMQTGINYVRRGYNIHARQGELEDDLAFQMVTYEVPLLATFYVQLGRALFMNASLGFSTHFVPHPLQSGKRHDFAQFSERHRWVIPAAVSNFGFEIRTENSGYFYIGHAYHIFFSPKYYTFIEYNRNGVKAEVNGIRLSGDYFGITLRYIFPPK